MGSIKRIIILTIGICYGLFVPLLGTDVSTQEEIPNVFARDPIKPYLPWFCPYKVILDQDKVSVLNQQIQQIPLEEAAKYDLREFGDEERKERSAFLFPVLALHGEKGAIFLERFLAPYVQQEELDDQWLLITASLGRNNSKKAQQVLEKEFQRILPKYSLYKEIKIGNQIVKRYVLDVRQPILDALLSCMAARNTLTGDEVKKLNRQMNEKHLQSLLFRASLDWGRQHLDEPSLMKLIEYELLMCSANDLKKSNEMQLGVSNQLMAIHSFLTWPQDNWPLTRKLVLWQKKRSKALFELLRVEYLLILTFYADINQGVYPIDKEIAKLYNLEINKSKRLAYNCYILSACKPSQEIPDWQSFLKKHAELIDSKEKPPADYQIEQIHKLKSANQNVYSVEMRNKHLKSKKKPGVYMIGFGAQKDLHRK